MRKKQRYYFRESKPKVEANRSSIDCTTGNSSFVDAPFVLEDLTWHAVDLNKRETDGKTKVSETTLCETPTPVVV